jgi:tetratricopeptide (TPR) repeat protein
MRMLLLLALVCAPLLYSQADPVLKPAPKAGQADIADGEDAFEAGRMQEAVDAFTRALKAQPKNDEVLAYRAAAYVALNKLDDALADVEEAIKLESAFSLAWNTRGYLRWLRRDFKGAVADYTAAIAYAADDRRVDTGGRAQMYQNRGVAWQDAGNTDRALLDFDSCIDLQPQNPAFYENRGLIYVDKQLFDVAFKDFDRALELDGKNARGYVNRAWAARLMGDFEQAVRDYSQALRLKPDYGQALIGRGYAWIGWERPELAKKDFESAEKLEGFESAAQVGIGELAMLNGDASEALKHFTKAQLLDTWSAPAWQGVARAQLLLKSYKQADESVRVLCRMAPQNVEHWLLCAEIQEARADWEGAVAALNRALELTPGHIGSLKRRVRAYAKLGMFSAAMGDVNVIDRSDLLVGCVESARVSLLVGGDSWKRSVLAYLASAKELGADLSALKDDADFASLKDDPEFKKLIS